MLICRYLQGGIALLLALVLTTQGWATVPGVSCWRTTPLFSDSFSAQALNSQPIWFARSSPSSFQPKSQAGRFIHPSDQNPVLLIRSQEELEVAAPIVVQSHPALGEIYAALQRYVLLRQAIAQAIDQHDRQSLDKHYRDARVEVAFLEDLLSRWPRSRQQGPLREWFFELDQARSALTFLSDSAYSREPSYNVSLKITARDLRHFSLPANEQSVLALAGIDFAQIVSAGWVWEGVPLTSDFIVPVLDSLYEAPPVALIETLEDRWNTWFAQHAKDMYVATGALFFVWVALFAVSLMQTRSTSSPIAALGGTDEIVSPEVNKLISSDLLDRLKKAQGMVTETPAEEAARLRETNLIASQVAAVENRIRTQQAALNKLNEKLKELMQQKQQAPPKPQPQLPPSASALARPDSRQPLSISPPSESVVDMEFSQDLGQTFIRSAAAEVFDIPSSSWIPLDANDPGVAVVDPPGTEASGYSVRLRVRQAVTSLAVPGGYAPIRSSVRFSDPSVPFDLRRVSQGYRLVVERNAVEGRNIFVEIAFRPVPQPRLAPPTPAALITMHRQPLQADTEAAIQRTRQSPTVPGIEALKDFFYDGTEYSLKDITPFRTGTMIEDFDAQREIVEGVLRRMGECKLTNTTLVAALRDAGIPARVVYGYLVKSPRLIMNVDGHMKAEAWIGSGWHLLDATAKDRDGKESHYFQGDGEPLPSNPSSPALLSSAGERDEAESKLEVERQQIENAIEDLEGEYDKLKQAVSALVAKKPVAKVSETALIRALSQELDIIRKSASESISPATLSALVARHQRILSAAQVPEDRRAAFLAELYRRILQNSQNASPAAVSGYLQQMQNWLQATTMPQAWVLDRTSPASTITGPPQPTARAWVLNEGHFPIALDAWNPEQKNQIPFFDVQNADSQNSLQTIENNQGQIMAVVGGGQIYRVEINGSQARLVPMLFPSPSMKDFKLFEQAHLKMRSMPNRWILGWNLLDQSNNPRFWDMLTGFVRPLRNPVEAENFAVTKSGPAYFFDSTDGVIQFHPGDISQDVPIIPRGENIKLIQDPHGVINVYIQEGNRIRWGPLRGTQNQFINGSGYSPGAARPSEDQPGSVLRIIASPSGATRLLYERDDSRMSLYQLGSRFLAPWLNVIDENSVVFDGEKAYYLGSNTPDSYRIYQAGSDSPVAQDGKTVINGQATLIGADTGRFFVATGSSLKMIAPNESWTHPTQHWGLPVVLKGEVWWQSRDEARKIVYFHHIPRVNPGEKLSSIQIDEVARIENADEVYGPYVLGDRVVYGVIYNGVWTLRSLNGPMITAIQRGEIREDGSRMAFDAKMPDGSLVNLIWDGKKVTTEPVESQMRLGALAMNPFLIPGEPGSIKWRPSSTGDGLESGYLISGKEGVILRTDIRRDPQPTDDYPSYKNPRFRVRNGERSIGSAVEVSGSNGSMLVQTSEGQLDQMVIAAGTFQLMHPEVMTSPGWKKFREALITRQATRGVRNEESTLAMYWLTRGHPDHASWAKDLQVRLSHPQEQQFVRKTLASIVRLVYQNARSAYPALPMMLPGLSGESWLQRWWNRDLLIFRGHTPLGQFNQSLEEFFREFPAMRLSQADVPEAVIPESALFKEWILASLARPFFWLLWVGVGAALLARWAARLRADSMYRFTVLADGWMDQMVSTFGYGAMSGTFSLARQLSLLSTSENKRLRPYFSWLNDQPQEKQFAAWTLLQLKGLAPSRLSYGKRVLISVLVIPVTWTAWSTWKLSRLWETLKLQEVDSTDRVRPVVEDRIGFIPFMQRAVRGVWRPIFQAYQRDPETRARKYVRQLIRSH